MACVDDRFTIKNFAVSLSLSLALSRTPNVFVAIACEVVSRHGSRVATVDGGLRSLSHRQGWQRASANHGHAEVLAVQWPAAELSRRPSSPRTSQTI